MLFARQILPHIFAFFQGKIRDICSMKLNILFFRVKSIRSYYYITSRKVSEERIVKPKLSAVT